MSRNGAPPVAGSDPTQASARWWLFEDKDEQARSLSYTLQHLKERGTARTTQWVVSARLYGNNAMLGRAGLTFSRVSTQHPWLKERISWNCVQSASDTVTAKIAKNRPKPLFLSSGGDYKIQRRSKFLSQFVDGVFYENDAYAKGVQAFLDGAVWGDGVIHVYAEDTADGPRVRFERVLASELWVDELDGFYGAPRTMHRAKDIDKDVVIERARLWIKDDKEYEVAAQKIRDAPPSQPDNSADFIVDQVEVVESWHLPSGPNATDGRHVISIKDFALVSEPWEHDFFPFAFFTWTKRLYGFWGQGLAEQLQNIQFEINTLLSTIKQSFWKGGTFRVFIPIGSQVSSEKITNQIGPVIHYTGTNPPTVVTPPLVQPEIFAHLTTLWQKAFEQAGVSQLSAASLKPAGLNSGVGLREYNDIESDRFMTIGQNYERFYLSLAKLAIATVKDITKGRRSYTVKVPEHGKFIREIDWKDVNLTEDQYVMKVYPVSSLPQDPAGRLQTIQEWVQAGWINPRAGRRLMDFPDLEMAEGLANAAEDYLTQILEKIVDEGKFTPPEPLDDLVLARELALEFYQRGKVQGLEEEKLEMLRRFLTQVQGIQQQAAAMAAAAQQQGPMGAPAPAAGPPQAAPMPPPQSQLVPNVPQPATPA